MTRVQGEQNNMAELTRLRLLPGPTPPVLPPPPVPIAEGRTNPVSRGVNQSPFTAHRNRVFTFKNPARYLMGIRVGPSSLRLGVAIREHKSEDDA